MILMDEAQKQLDAAAAKYRRAYNRGYGLSERGEIDKAQAILDRANAEYNAAKAAFEATRRRQEGLPNPCIHTPSRCNGGGYDGCACGPYPS